MIKLNVSCVFKMYVDFFECPIVFISKKTKSALTGDAQLVGRCPAELRVLLRFPHAWVVDLMGPM